MKVFGKSGESVVVGYESQLFRIDGGDGDQELFSSPLILQRVSAPWFDGELGQSFGDGWLVKVVEGVKEGLLLGLTPRTIGEIAEGVSNQGWKSVVVHGVEYPGYDVAAYGPRSLVGGMAFLERYRS